MNVKKSTVLIRLLKGILYRDQYPEVWNDLLLQQGPVREYFAELGLTIYLDEAEGYAFLKQDPAVVEETKAEETKTELPTLIPQRPLSYPQSILCVLLRKRLLEHETSGGEGECTIGQEQIVEMMQVYLPPRRNEAKMHEDIVGYIKRLARDYGFLRPLKHDETQYEIRRILKAFVNADWLNQLLTEYRTYAEEHVGTTTEE